MALTVAWGPGPASLREGWRRVTDPLATLKRAAWYRGNQLHDTENVSLVLLLFSTPAVLVLPSYLLPILLH